MAYVNMAQQKRPTRKRLEHGTIFIEDPATNFYEKERVNLYEMRARWQIGIPSGQDH